MTLDSATSGDDSQVTLGQLPKFLPWYDVIFPHILVNLTYSDLFKLRRVSKSFYLLVDAYFANCTTIDLTTATTTATTRVTKVHKTMSSPSYDDHKNCLSVTMNETGTNELLMVTRASSDQFNSGHHRLSSLESLGKSELKLGQSSTGHTSWYSSGEKLDDLPPKCTSSGHTIQFNSETFAIILRQKELYSAHRCLESVSCFEEEEEVEREEKEEEEEEEEEEEPFDSPEVNFYANTRSLEHSISSSISKVNEVEHRHQINMHPSVFYISKNFNSYELKVNFPPSNDAEELVNLKYCPNDFSAHKSYGSTDQFDGCRCDAQVNCCQCKLCLKFCKYFTPTFEKIFLTSNIFSIELNVQQRSGHLQRVDRVKNFSETSESKIKKEAKCNDLVKNDTKNRDQASSIPSKHCHNQCKLATSWHGYCNNINRPVKSRKKILTTDLARMSEKVDRLKEEEQNERKMQDESKNWTKISSIHHSHRQHVINSNSPSKNNKVTGIKKLILSSCNWLTDGDLLRINNCCTLQPQLEVLDLSSCYQISNEMVSSLLLRCHRSLKILRLRQCHWINEETINTIGLCTNLQELDLTACWALTNEHQIHLITKCCSKLNVVSLQRIYSLTHKSLFYLSNLPNLTHLDISDCFNVTTSSLVHLLQDCTKLTTLIIKKCPQVDINNPLLQLLKEAHKVKMII